MRTRATTHRGALHSHDWARHRVARQRAAVRAASAVPPPRRSGRCAAVLRSFAVDGTDYTERWPDERLPPMGAGIVLMPWPNRVADGRWEHDGRAQQLDITEPATGNAIHGLLRNAAYEPTSISDDAVTLTCGVFPQHGFPFVLDTSVRYSLTDDGLRVEHGVTNVGATAAPFGCGSHPVPTGRPRPRSTDPGADHRRSAPGCGWTGGCCRSGRSRWPGRRPT